MRKLLTAVISVLFSMSLAMAAPSAPEFLKPGTIGNGSINNWLNKRMLFNGPSVYVGFAGSDGAVRVARSDNGGATWSPSEVLQAPTANLTPDAASLRLAIGPDPAFPGKKIIHAAWYALDPARVIVYYAYKLDRPKQTAWSKPKKIDLGSLQEAGGVSGGMSMAVSSTGAIHILCHTRYVTAAGFDAAFGQPALLPEPADGTTFMAMDPENNLYATYVKGNHSLMMVRKGAAAPEWSKPAVVFTSKTSDGLSANHELVVVDSSKYFIGAYEANAGRGEAFLLSTNDAGNTWTRQSVYTNEIDGDNCFSIAVSPANVIYFASEVYDNNKSSVIKVWRSDNNGLNWSPPTTIKGQKLPNIAIDGAGKLNVMVMDATGTRSPSLLWVKEK